MANVKITIVVNCYAEKLYLCGNTPQLGMWDPNKAVELKKNEKGDFEISKMLPQGQMIEFKFMNEKSWDAVEKGRYGEELDNHILFVSKGLEPQVYGIDKFGD